MMTVTQFHFFSHNRTMCLFDAAIADLVLVVVIDCNESAIFKRRLPKLLNSLEQHWLRSYILDEYPTAVGEGGWWYSIFVAKLLKAFLLVERNVFMHMNPYIYSKYVRNMGWITLILNFIPNIQMMFNIQYFILSIITLNFVCQLCLWCGIEMRYLDMV